MSALLPLGPSAFPAEDEVGETLLQFLIRSLLVSLVRRWFADRGERSLVGSDQFVYWDRENPHRCVAPDLYVVRGEDPHRPVRCWQVWNEAGKVPALALEVVSEGVSKDYLLAPKRYAELGVEELVIYDPEFASGRDRLRWQIYRRGGSELTRVVSSNDDRVPCEVLGCFLRELPGDDGQPRLRLATGPTGDDLVASAEEEVMALRAELETLRATRR